METEHNMPCSQCQPNVNVFGEGFARRELKRYRKDGPDGTTRILLDALKAEGVDGQTLLDIGGGVGAIQLELLRSGVTEATDVDASPDYVTSARAEAQRVGVSDRVRYLTGDFVALAPEIEPAGVVTLDRVLCCYADMRRLVGESASRATKLYGLVYPRDTPLFRAASRVMGALTALFRGTFRFYVHPSADVDAILRANGLAPRFHRHGFFWQVAVYARPDAA
jgi:magnesium-protoporphyrin O-methyltransferase